MVETKLKDYLKTHPIQWADDLPEGAPPETVLVPDNDVFYRITKGNRLTKEDLISYLQQYPHKYEGKTKILSSGLSVLDDFDAAKNKMRLSMFRDCKGIAKLVFVPVDGVVVKSSKDIHHYTWWRTQSFDLSKAEMETL